MLIKFKKLLLIWANRCLINLSNDEKLILQVYLFSTVKDDSGFLPDCITLYSHFIICCYGSIMIIYISKFEEHEMFFHVKKKQVVGYSLVHDSLYSKFKHMHNSSFWSTANIETYKNR